MILFKWSHSPVFTPFREIETNGQRVKTFSVNEGFIETYQSRPDQFRELSPDDCIDYNAGAPGFLPLFRSGFVSHNSSLCYEYQSKITLTTPGPAPISTQVCPMGGQTLAVPGSNEMEM